MKPRADRLAMILAVALVTGAVARPGLAGGFAASEQDAHAASMGGAFTAITGNPSSLFYNVGAAAFFEKKAHQVGVATRASYDFTFEDQPAVGTPTVFGQADPSALLLHAYTIHPVQPYLNLGVALYSPFDFDNTWNMPDDFPGRTVSTSSRLETLDLNVSGALRLGEKLGIGAGVVYRSSELKTSRRLQTQDPSSVIQPPSLLDFASLALATGQNEGFGWNFGVLHRPSERFSWGLAYRSKVRIDYSGGSLLTQIPTGNELLDSLLALTNPFGQELATDTRIEFPDVASFGVAIGDPSKLLVALDVVWTGWSSVQEIDIDVREFPNFGQVITQSFDDSFTYRLGVQLQDSRGNEYRVGYVFDESPQPDATVGPFFYDAERNAVSLGIGLDWLDVALRWVSYEKRSSTFTVGPPGQTSSASGRFSGEALSLMVSAKKK